MHADKMADSAISRSGKRRVSSLWLPCGFAMLGVFMAMAQAFGIFGNLPATVAVKVNQSDIYMADYQRALTLMASEKRDALTAEDKQLVLDRLIEEELLVQYGQSLDLLRMDPDFRADVVRSLITRILQTSESSQTSESNQTVENTPDNETSEQALEAFIVQLRAEADITWLQ